MSLKNIQNETPKRRTFWYFSVMKSTAIGIYLEFLIFIFWILNYLAIDYGTRKSGLAYSVGSFAFGYGTVPTSELIETIVRVIWEKNITKIIIGMPYNIDGTMSKHGQRVKQFGKMLWEKIKLPVVYHDERLTSSEARMAFDEAWVDGDIDTESARLILEGYITRL